MATIRFVLGTRRLYYFPNTFGAWRCVQLLSPTAKHPHHWPSYVYAGQRQTPIGG